MKIKMEGRMSVLFWLAQLRFSILLFALFLVFPLHSSCSEDTSYTFTIRDADVRGFGLYSKLQVLVDTHRTLTIQDVLHDTAIQRRFVNFSNPDSLDAGHGAAYWTRVRLKNISGRTLFYYMDLGRADSSLIFRLDEAGYYQTLSGTEVEVNSKLVSTSSNRYPLVIGDGNEVTLITREISHGPLPVSISFYKRIIKVNYYRNTNYFTAFATGIQVILLILGVLLFLVFRQPQYLICVLPILGFMLWFSDVNGAIYGIIPLSPQIIKNLNPAFTSWFMPISVMIFLLSYVEVYRRSKALFYLGGAFVIAPILAAVVGIIIGVQANYSNIAIQGTIITGLIISAWYAIKGVRQAKIWLLFTTPLLLGGSSYLIKGFFPNLPISPLDAMFYMELAALFSCFIIAYILYDRVNHSIRESFRLLRENERLINEQNIILEKKVEERTQELKSEKEKSEELLLNILPGYIAEELKLKGTAEAKYHEGVTVLFADIRNFTQTAEKLTPEELVRKIDTYFRAFDRIIEECRLEKIKTIGDAYLCAGGLNGGGEGQAVQVVSAALEMQKFVNQMKVEFQEQGQPFFEVRIGIHTGPVVAGVVGVKKFAYDIWGDTVNTASRMESCSEPGKVNISKVTYQLVHQDFECHHRGKLAAKNKGLVDMYFVKNRRNGKVQSGALEVVTN